MNPSLDAVSAALQRHAELSVAIAFGSVAKGRQRADSDLDVAVLAGRPLDAAEKLALIEELAGASGRPVDLVDLHGLHGPVLSRLLREGELLLRRDPAALANLSLRAIYDEADFLPYRRRIIEERRRAWTAS